MNGPPAHEVPFRWRTRSYVLFGAGALLLIVGVSLANPDPLFLALPMLLAPVAAALLGPRSAPRVSAEWRIQGTGRKVRVVGAFSFEPPTDPRDVEVECPVPPGLEEASPPLLERRARQLRIDLRWEAPEPVVVPVPPPRLRWRDPAGLVERAVRLDATELVVERYPAELVHLGAIRLERTIASPGETRSRRTGSSGEFFRIRDASPSEPPRRINWLASARTGRLMANDFEVERTGDILLLIDARPTSLGQAVDAQLLSLTVAAAYGIAESFLREKARVGLGVFGEFLDVVPLAGGRAQRLRIREALLRVRLATDPGPAERCAIALRRYFPPGVTTVLLSSLADDASGHLVPHVRRRGFPVVVLSPSPLPLIADPRVPPDSDEELVARIARLLRRHRLARTWQDAPVVDWEEYWSLARLVDLLRRPGRRGRGA